MAGTITIELNQLRFFATHGVYEEEAILGNEFEVSIALTFPAPEHILTSIEETINYVRVYEIVAEEINYRSLLLETCAMRIAEQLQQQFPQMSSIAITIKKLTPLIAWFTGSVGVTYTKSW